MSLLENQQKIIKVKDLLKMLPEVIQFDWGDFFLFKYYPEHWENSSRKFYRDRIVLTDTTIRAVDDQYIYVYTPYKQIVNLINENYTIESIKIDSLDKLDYPQ